MPSWINIDVLVTGSPEALDKFQETFVDQKTGKADFDFHKVDPIPAALMETESTTDTLLAMAYAWDSEHGEEEPSLQLLEAISDFMSFQEIREEAKGRYARLEPNQQKDYVRRGKKYLANLEQYGVPSWYEWTKEHWGTKWSAMDTALKYVREPEPRILMSYRTADNFPFAALEKVTTMFSVDLHCRFFEDCTEICFACDISSGETEPPCEALEDDPLWEGI